MVENKRYVNLRAYQRMYGGSYATLKRACEMGELPCITTPAGHFLIDTTPAGADIQPVLDELGEMKRQLQALCKHLGAEGARR